MSKKNTKRALLTSALSLILCFTMLLGTTYAWFTDSVTSGGNKIVAGNLDVTLEYISQNDVDDEQITLSEASLWADVEGKEDLFDANALWEPGHVEVVYLRVGNVGSLALNYRLLVYPETEIPGTNVYGESFKLSDYIKYSTVELNGNAQTYTTRASAVEAAGDGAAIGTYEKTGGLIAGAEDVYLALIAWMPTTVGNEANYKTGTAAPEISMKVILEATQKVEENDSFGNDYDAGADGTPDHPEFPQDPETAYITSELVNTDGDTVLSVDNVTVTVPEDATSASSLTLSVSKLGEDTDNEGITTLEMEIELLDENGDKVLPTEPITVSVYVGAERIIAAVKHNGVDLDDYTYNITTGYITFETTSFSPFEFSYYEIPENAAFVSSADDLYAAISNSDVNAVVLTNDIALSEILMVGQSKTVYGNGHRISSTKNRVVRITAGNLDVKFYNTKIISECTDTSDVRGISFDGQSSGSSLLLDGCLVSASFYAINFVPGAENLEVTIKNGTVAAGWAAINSYSNNSTFNITDSTLKGINDKTESSWNNFSTIVFDSNGLHNADNLGTFGSGNIVNISKSTVYSSSDSENKQYWLGIQYGALRNTVTVNDSSLIDEAGADMTDNFIVGDYMNYNSTNETWDYYDNSSNNIVVDGKTLFPED